MLKKILENIPKDFEKLSDTCYKFNGLYLELRTETINDLMIDCVVFKSENDLNTDYDLHIDLYVEKIDNAEEFWNSVKNKMIHTSVWLENQKSNNVKEIIYRALTIAKNRRFKTIDDLCNQIAVQNGVYKINLVEGEGDIICDNYLIGQIGVVNEDNSMEYDIQLFYIKDNLEQYYITEFTLLEEVI